MKEKKKKGKNLKRKKKVNPKLYLKEEFRQEDRREKSEVKEKKKCKLEES